ncbi:MAG: protein kinase [Phormidesmis sp.]
MLYCLNPDCPSPQNPDSNVHCQHCGAPLALRNRFKAVRPLGKGGFGTTYLAQDLDNRLKSCVIKRFSYQGSSAQATAKAEQLFEQEAERLDQLIHPQIPRLLAYFQEGHHLYLVQELIDGHTLQAELSQSGPFDEVKIRAVLQGLLPILQFVHSRNVIHRDIKPDNIMRRQTGQQIGQQIDPQAGQLVLIDFGVAKLLEQSSLAKTGTTIGTPGFSAPEQTYGRVTPASDLFALGATCFELLTQSFSSDDSGMLGYGWTNHWQQYVQQPLSPELMEVLSGLIALEERSRFSTAGAVLQALNKGQPPAPGNNPQAHLSSLPTVAVAPAAPSPSSVGGSPVGGSPVGHPSASSSPASSSPANNFLTSASVPNVAVPQAAVPPAPPTVISASPVSPAPIAAAESIRPVTVQKVPIGLFFWCKYGLLTYIGQALGFLLAMVVAAFYAVQFSQRLQDDMNALLSFIRLLYWVVGGFTVGIGQWIALRTWLRWAVVWVPMTVGGYWAIALSRIAFGNLSLFGSVVIGVCIGVLQWIALRKHTPRAQWWIPWATSMAIILFQVLTTNQYANFLVWGALWPMLDGLFLTWVLKRKQSLSS